MASSNSTILRVSLLLCLQLVVFITSSAAEPYEDLQHCLIHHSSSLEPIKSAIYTPSLNSTSYSTVLRRYIRNLRFNTSTTPKPILILAALHESHIQSAVFCARYLSILMRIRSGGHDYEGLSYTTLNPYLPFFVLDMFNLRSIDVDLETETAWVQTGATLGELYYGISKVSGTHGFPGGVCPTVGVGGHISGGGYGNLMRKYGLTVDNIVDARVVNADGQLLDRQSMGEDLFWAIRGGGGASFGVVTSYKLNLVRVPENVTLFRVQRTLADNNNAMLDAVMQWQEAVTENKLVNDLFVRLTMEVVNTVTGDKTIRATFRAMYLGDKNTLHTITNTALPKLGVTPSDCYEMSWINSVLFWQELPFGTQPELLLNRTPNDPLSYLKIKSDYVQKPISRYGFQSIWHKMLHLEASPSLALNPYGGRMAEIASDATPFPHRAGNLYMIQYELDWNLNDESEKFIGFTRELYLYMTPYVSVAPREAFMNGRDIDLGVNWQGRWRYLEARTYGIKYFKTNFYRLVRVKTQVDPTNFFRHEQSVPVLPGKL